MVRFCCCEIIEGKRTCSLVEGHKQLATTDRPLQLEVGGGGLILAN